MVSASSSIDIAAIAVLLRGMRLYGEASADTLGRLLVEVGVRGGLSGAFFSAVAS
jgi:hypothetical protein